MNFNVNVKSRVTRTRNYQFETNYALHRSTSKYMEINYLVDCQHASQDEQFEPLDEKNHICSAKFEPNSSFWKANNIQIHE